MDLDAYSAAHRQEWDRLDALGKQRFFSGPEADELIDRYQAGATQLSAIKTTAGSTLVGDRLSVSLSRATPITSYRLPLKCSYTPGSRVSSALTLRA